MIHIVNTTVQTSNQHGTTVAMCMIWYCGCVVVSVGYRSHPTNDTSILNW